MPIYILNLFKNEVLKLETVKRILVGALDPFLLFPIAMKPWAEQKLSRSRTLKFHSVLHLQVVLEIESFLKYISFKIEILEKLIIN